MDVEIHKLRALNKINIEIRDRIIVCRVSDSGFVYTGTYPTIEFIGVLNVITFTKDFIKVESCERFFEGLGAYKKNEIYADCSKALDDLKSEDASLLKRWKEALEKSQILLGKQESEALQYHTTLLRYKDLLGLPEWFDMSFPLHYVSRGTICDAVYRCIMDDEHFEFVSRFYSFWTRAFHSHSMFDTASVDMLIERSAKIRPEFLVFAKKVIPIALFYGGVVFGGFIRDLVLGEDPSDLDINFSLASLPEVERFVIAISEIYEDPECTVSPWYKGPSEDVSIKRAIYHLRKSDATVMTLHNPKFPTPEFGIDIVLKCPWKNHMDLDVNTLCLDLNRDFKPRVFTTLHYISVETLCEKIRTKTCSPAICGSACRWLADDHKNCMDINVARYVYFAERGWKFQWDPVCGTPSSLLERVWCCLPNAPLNDEE